MTPFMLLTLAIRSDEEIILGILANLSKGPVQAYLKKVDDAITDVGYGSGWFKIQEAGLNVASKKLTSSFDWIYSNNLQLRTGPLLIW